MPRRGQVWDMASGCKMAHVTTTPKLTQGSPTPAAGGKEQMSASSPTLSPWLHFPARMTGSEKQSSLEPGCLVLALSCLQLRAHLPLLLPVPHAHCFSASCSRLVRVRLLTLQFQHSLSASSPAPLLHLASQSHLQSFSQITRHISCLRASDAQQCGRTGAGDRSGPAA